MPCNTIQRSTVELKAADADLLASALESLGYRAERDRNGRNTVRFYDRNGAYVGCWREGRLDVPRTVEVNAVKRAYSVQVVRAAAKRFGWRLADRDARHFVATRRF